MSFDLEQILEALKNTLPRQAPLQHFIARNNLLYGFQKKPFQEAMINAHRLLGGQPYLSLQEYGLKYTKGQIEEQSLQESLWAFGFTPPYDGWAKEALFEWISFKDAQSFLSYCEQKQVNNTKAKAWVKALEGHLKQQKAPVFSRKQIEAQLGQNIDNHINPVLFRILSSYLDQGIGIWKFPSVKESFFTSLRELAQNSFLPLIPFLSNQKLNNYLLKEPKEVILHILQRLVSGERHYESYIWQTLFSHPGWSGMVAQIEENPRFLLKHTPITLQEWLALKLILEWEWIQGSKKAFEPILPVPTDSKEGVFLSVAAFLIQKKVPFKNLLEASCEMIEFLEKLNDFNLRYIWQEAFERTYYTHVLNTISGALKIKKSPPTKPRIQAFFCIDDRECSFRRYLEETNPYIETFGTPGFFGIDAYFQSLNDNQPVQLCPVHLTPKHIIKEVPAKGLQVQFMHEKKRSKQTAKSYLTLHHASTSMVLGFIAANTLGHLSFFQLLICLLNPKKMASFLNLKTIEIETEIALLPKELSSETALQEGFTYEEMATRVEGVLKSIGLLKDFTPLVVAIAHGSSSMNNPHFAAYDCGACSGKPGSPNARIFAQMANLKPVRELLIKKGLAISDETYFLGGYHDTCTDEVVFFDISKMPKTHENVFLELQKTIQESVEKNAKERMRRFLPLSLSLSPKEALIEAKKRSLNLFETRPELGHATNALCIIGRRSITKNLFLDRRAFLNSYDPFTDDDGEVLAGVLSAAVPVCSGINLEYHFSRIDNAVYGSGTKLSHNVCGLLGVYNAVDDDLRAGLPKQTTELHEPVRLLLIIDQTKPITLKALQKVPSAFALLKNAWIRLACLDPYTQECEFLEWEEGPQINPVTPQNILTAKTFLELANTRHLIPVTLVEKP